MRTALTALRSVVASLLIMVRSFWKEHVLGSTVDVVGGFNSLKEGRSMADASEGKGVGSKKGTQVRVRPRCEKCGKRIRGPNHDEGVHHTGKTLGRRG